MAEEKETESRNSVGRSSNGRIIEKGPGRGYRNHIRPEPDHEGLSHRRRRRLLPDLRPGSLSGAQAQEGGRGNQNPHGSVRRHCRDHHRPEFRPHGTRPETSAHNDHSRGVALLFKEVAHGKAQGYQIKDVAKLKKIAKDWDVAISEGEGDDKKARSAEAIAQEMADKVLKSSVNRKANSTISNAPPRNARRSGGQQGVVPRGCDIEVVELMHRTHMGVDQEYKNIIKQCTRCALSDGWGGSMISTDLQDIMFGMPVPVSGEINLGVLKEDHVNIIMHGHEPLLPEMIYVVSQEPEMIQYAQNKGAKGIQLAGMCCSANEILMRHGIPGGGQLPAAGTGHDHRRGGRHGGGRAVRNAVPGQHRQMLPHQADHHGQSGHDRRRDHAHPL